MEVGIPKITMLAAALIGLLTLTLGIRVSAYRGKADKLYGYEGDDQLMRRVRAHGNITEWVPITLIVLALIEMAGAPALAIWILGAALVISRVMHAIGIMGTAEPVNRVGGIVLNWLVVVLASAYAIYLFFAGPVGA